MKKIIFCLLLLSNLAYAGFQTLSIGTIDKHYKDTLSKEQLLIIIEDIENVFESELGYNVFDYAQDGKPIDIIYLPASKKKKKLLSHIKKAESLKTNIDKMKSYIGTMKNATEKSRLKLEKRYKILNNTIKELNIYISEQQKKSHEMSKKEHDGIHAQILKRKGQIKKNQTSLTRNKKEFNRKIMSLKQKVRKSNRLVAQYNKTQRDIERLSSSLVEVKGVTKFQVKTNYTQSDEQGKLEESRDIQMQKIEIYSFKDLAQLKVVLAHEIGHLVGVEHINEKDALMNPYLQSKQLQELSLTYDDIQGFYKAFE